jgi:hypothetical protein
MAVTFAELHDGGRIDYDMSTSPIRAIGATRRFSSPGYNETAAIASAINAANGQLNLYAPHPREPKLRLASLGATDRIGADADAGWYVEARYVAVGETVPTVPQDPDAVGVITKQASVESVLIPYPLLARRYVLQPTTDGSPAYENITYTNDEGRIEVAGVRYTFQVNLDRSPDNTLGIIVPRYYKIHQLPPFGTTKWLFLGCYISQIKADRWSYVYNWFTEPGNPALIPAAYAAPDNGSTRDLIYVPPRLPHEKYLVRYRDLGPDVTVSPSVEVINTYTEDFNAWAGLPGVTFGGGF